jgi:hypothetical protein
MAGELIDSSGTMSDLAVVRNPRWWNELEACIQTALVALAYDII